MMSDSESDETESAKRAIIDDGADGDDEGAGDDDDDNGETAMEGVQGDMQLEAAEVVEQRMDDYNAFDQSLGDDDESPVEHMEEGDEPIEVSWSSPSLFEIKPINPESPFEGMPLVMIGMILQHLHPLERVRAEEGNIFNCINDLLTL